MKRIGHYSYTAMTQLPDRTVYTKPMRWLGRVLPGNFLKTFVYLNFIQAPRRILRTITNAFYRMDHIYDVLKEFKQGYRGPFSILELGTANGYSFVKMLYAIRYMNMEDRVTVHAFDSFEGLRPPSDKEEQGLISNDWEAGQYRGNYETLKDYCEAHHYSNYKIHKGYFEDTLTPLLINELKTFKAILVWVDCDYYSSAKTVFERLLPILPSGCVFYFDDWEFNFGSRFTGEARLIYEVNRGMFGDYIELIPDRKLSLDSNRVYRFIHFDQAAIQFERLSKPDWQGKARPIGNGSPLP